MIPSKNEFLVAYPGEKSPGENRTFSQKYTLGNV